MKEKTLETFLFCNHCKEEEGHIIVYLNNRISEIKCQTCGLKLSIQIDLSHELYNEVYKRIRSKPARMTEEYRNHISQFLMTLPVRVISKPYRVYREVKEIRGYFRKYDVKRG
ncbi:bh protein [Paenibacillus filicis]|uniref:Bh protein n=1 Tax=Paenibacillus filicis TaxID=669464 RepID=A0ABU9DTE9_9BACL